MTFEIFAKFLVQKLIAKSFLAENGFDFFDLF